MEDNLLQRKSFLLGRGAKGRGDLVEKRKIRSVKHVFLLLTLRFSLG